MSVPNPGVTRLARIQTKRKGHAAFATWPLFSRRRPTLPHTCGAGALARETCPSAREHLSANIYLPHVHLSQTKIIGPLTLRTQRRPGAAAPHNQSCMSINQTLEKYRYRRRLPHLQKADAALFVTFCTAARVNLPAEARDLVLAHCLREAATSTEAGEGARPTCVARIRLHAVVVMPDHVHLLLTPLRSEQGWPAPLVDILQCLKEERLIGLICLLRYLRPGLGRGIVRSCAAVG